MKTSLLRILTLIVFANCLGAVNVLHAQGTAFTYQGRLLSGANPANGSYDLTFALFSVSSGEGQTGGTLTNPATAASNGLLTVALDFGNPLPGAARRPETDRSRPVRPKPRPWYQVNSGFGTFFRSPTMTPNSGSSVARFSCISKSRCDATRPAVFAIIGKPILPRKPAN